VICNALAAKTVPFAVPALARALLLVYFDIWAILNYRHNVEDRKFLSISFFYINGIRNQENHYGY